MQFVIRMNPVPIVLQMARRTAQGTEGPSATISKHHRAPSTNRGKVGNPCTPLLLQHEHPHIDKSDRCQKFAVLNRRALVKDSVIYLDLSPVIKTERLPVKGEL